MEAMKGNNPQHFDFMPTRPMHDLSLEPDSAMMHAPYDFGSAASSPARARDFHIAMPTTARAYVPTTMAQFQHSPVSYSAHRRAVRALLIHVSGTDYKSRHVPDWSRRVSDR